MVDAAYPFDVAATLRLAHAESGRFDVLGDDQLVRCVNPERESLTWFYGVDGDDGELVDYHELDDFEARRSSGQRRSRRLRRRRWTCRWLTGRSWTSVESAVRP